MKSFPIRILHNPRCSTSRKTLEWLREQGHEPEVVEYLAHPPTRSELERIIEALGPGGERRIVRRKDALAAELGLLDESVTRERVVDALLAHPVLMERPVVTTPIGTRIARPLETLQEVLPPT